MSKLDWRRSKRPNNPEQVAPKSDTAGLSRRERRAGLDALADLAAELEKRGEIRKRKRTP